jgi:hypothetical protein
MDLGWRGCFSWPWVCGVRGEAFPGLGLIGTNGLGWRRFHAGVFTFLRRVERRGEGGWGFLTSAGMEWSSLVWNCDMMGCDRMGMG